MITRADISFVIYSTLFIALVRSQIPQKSGQSQEKNDIFSQKSDNIVPDYNLKSTWYILEYIVM